MAEQTHHQNYDSLASQEQSLFDASSQRYLDQLDILKSAIPELEESPNALIQTGNELIDYYELRPELFDDPARTIVFAAIAGRCDAVKGVGGEAADAERRYLIDSLALLTHDYSDRLTGVKQAIEAGGLAGDEELQLDIFNTYTDHELTASLQEEVDLGLLDGVKSDLSVTDENEDPYQLHVMDIGLLDGSDGKAAAFWSELGVEDQGVPAWTISIKGQNLLCVSTELTKMLLDPKTSNKQYAAIRRILEHEYTHTQGGVGVDSKGFFASNYEELRADHYSRHTSYPDLAAFAADYEQAGGTHPQDHFNKHPKGGDAATLLISIANEVGMSQMLDLVLQQPETHETDQNNAFSTRIKSHLQNQSKKAS